MTKVVFNEATGAFEDADNTPDPHPAPASQQTDVLFHASLIDREWGASLLSVAKLLTWVQSQGLELVTMPDLEGFRFVQPEALLSAIQRATASQTDPRTAAAVIEATPALAGHAMAGIAPAWLLGGDAYLGWRKLIGDAIQSGDLTPLDFASKLPIESAPASQPTPMPDSIDFTMLATPAELLDAFGKWGLQATWFKDLNSRKWLLEARRKKGQGQKSHVIEPLFCPFAVMEGLVSKGRKDNRMNSDAGWRILEHKFPKVYAAFEEHDPRERTGD